MTWLNYNATRSYDTDIITSRRNLPPRCLPRRTSQTTAKMPPKPRSDLILQPHNLTHLPTRDQTHAHHNLSLTTTSIAMPHLRRVPPRHLQILPTLPYLPQRQRGLQVEESRKVRWDLRAPGAVAEARCRRDGEQREAGRTSR